MIVPNDIPKISKLDSDLKQENKQSFFRLSIRPAKEGGHSLNDILPKLDLVFEDMSVAEDVHVYLSLTDEKTTRVNSITDSEDIMNYPLNDSYEILSYFKTTFRKRPGQLGKSLNYHLKNITCYTIDHNGITKEKFLKDIDSARLNTKFLCLRLPSVMYRYNGDDLKLFDDLNKLYPWQKQVFKIIFDKDGEFNVADGRKIISLVDPVGNTGKSNFVKWICFRNSEEFIKLSYGTASQLRAAIVSAGQRRGYIIDLPRTQGSSDKIVDILAVIEDLKNGYVTTAMYGRNSSLMMEPPFVFVLSNKYLPYSSLSEDRWSTYEIVFSSKSLRSVTGEQLRRVEEEEKINKIREEVKKKLMEESLRQQITNDLKQEMQSKNPKNKKIQVNGTSFSILESPSLLQDE